MIVVQYPDDSVVCFEGKAEALRFLGDLKARLAAFRLSLNETQTRVLEFGRFADSRPTSANVPANAGRRRSTSLASRTSVRRSGRTGASID